MGKLIQNRNDIQSYQVNRVTEPDEQVVLHVIIGTAGYSVTYRICSDARHPNLSVIESDFNSELNMAHNGNLDIAFKEFIARSYIEVDFPSGTTQQYTGEKISER